MEAFDYSGNELELFALAKNWKSYWSSEIRPFIGEVVLEVGAGIGANANTLRSNHYQSWVCLEPDKTMCEMMKHRITQGTLPNYLEIRSGTIKSLNDSEKFDTILYIDVLEHIENDRGELKEAADRLISKGKVIIVSPAHNFLYSEFDKNIGHFRRYDKKMMIATIPEEFQVLEISYLDSVGLLASLVNKLLLRTANPTHAQIQIWDRFMVTTSRVIDPLFGRRIGKSIICVLEKV